MEELINIQNLSYSYGKTDVLDDISLSVKRGDFIGIIGSNGAGKSTLIKLIAGILKVQNGTVQVTDVDGQRPVISYVSQMQDKKSVNFPATVLEIVMLGLYPKIGPFKFANNTHKLRVMEALSLVGMEDFAKRLISELSGGQRQKVMLAKALVSEPDIMILDEPTTGVDKNSSLLIYETLKTINENDNITIIIISHDIKNLKKYCKSVYEIEYGKLKKYDI
ncbi:metal ABC transporter ATP-binding protein [Criibacterium bergeronii]|uniref:Metal ABC transporter ATP-binding protein n=1 Tax=Criibacterium bergeronii TaxID=1871336 RepID=A0A371INV9_9FIRM|nr:metal ABC transporter ATP-binding protein [Criibacterium bergeronii]MBS6062427.1 metal ABC transporter ATP-binding protein [Peptostreptococcaceae bacterium]RDY22177.1 metal ABC transporter ATP-binding protein [Criibacterium bergeronii]